VASAYADLAAAFAEQDVRQRALAVRQASRKLIAQRVTNGLDNRGSLRQADVEEANARAASIEAAAGLAAQRARLAALLGAGPDRGLDIVRPALAAPPLRPLPEDVTTDLVGRRPDVIALRERAQAAASRIDVARADFFPAIRLGALIGVQSLGLENLADAGSTFGSLGPAISLPIFRGGALSGRFREARSEFEEAVAVYDRAVVEAYRQVAQAATLARSSHEQLVQARTALVAAEESYGVAERRFRAGLANYLDVLAIEDRLLAARQRVAEAEAAVRTSDIALVQALGGGFAEQGQAAVTKDMPHG
jgi:NodT family efflux transporter outer membrane factor (OMF) lipoprotein